MSKQSMTALRYANVIRLEGARLRREMQGLPFSASRLRAIELLLNPPEPIQRMRVNHFLEGVRRIGPRRIPILLERAGLPPSAAESILGPDGTSTGRKPLTERQRRQLAQTLIKPAR